MLLIDHYVAKSDIHGLGVFSAENIEAGKLVSEFNRFIDREIPEALVRELPTHVREKIFTHAWHRPEINCFWLSADGDYFMNHSDTPTLELHDHRLVASRKIAIGDELTCDYRIVRVAAYDPNSIYETALVSQI